MTSPIQQFAAANAVLAVGAPAERMQMREQLVYQSAGDGVRVWAGQNTGGPVTGHVDSRARAISTSGDVVTFEAINVISRQDGSSITARNVGTFNRVTGALEQTGSVVEASGAWAHLLGRQTARSGVVSNLPYVPGKTTYDGTFTIEGGRAPSAANNTQPAAGEPEVSAVALRLVSAPVSAPLELVAPRTR